MRLNRYTITSVVAAGAVLAGGGAALADDGSDRAERCDAFLAKVAEKRGVSVEQLQANARARITKAIAAAEKAGKLTAEQAAAKRAKLAEATGCKAVAKKVRKARGTARRASFGMFAGAMDYLGFSKDELKAELKQGTTLAQLAAAKGKSVAGLKSAMLAKATVRLAKAVDAKKLTAEQSAKRLERLEKVADRLVERSFGRK
jgi:hypothetical protein